MRPKFYICRRCGNIVAMVNDSGVNPVCCGEKMEVIEPNTVEASGEKHIPVVSVDGSVIKVNVGSVDHPMLKEHYIQWILLQTEHGAQRKLLSPDDAPSVSFSLIDDTPVAVYAYCNLHGLWMSKV